jgi:amino acid transporter
MGKLFGNVAQRVAAAFVSLSALGFVMAHTFSMARVTQELAKEGMLPYGFIWASNWPVGAPMASIMLVLVVTMLNIVAIPFGKFYYFFSQALLTAFQVMPTTLSWILWPIRLLS